MSVSLRSFLIITALLIAAALALVWAGPVWSKSTPTPQPFLIYYGWIPHQPSRFHRFTEHLNGYSVVVLGSGDERATSGDLGPTTLLIQSMPDILFYGYVDIGMTHHQPHHPFTEIAASLAEWHSLHVKGVLLDCAGPDYGVSPARLHSIVTMAHQDHLHVLVNAFSPLAVLTAGLLPGDAWLAENWAIQNGQAQNAKAQGENLDALSKLRQRHISIWMTATDNHPPNAHWVKIWAPRTQALIRGQYLAVAGPDYSSQTNAVVPAEWIIDALQYENRPVIRESTPLAQGSDGGPPRSKCPPTASATWQRQSEW